MNVEEELRQLRAENAVLKEQLQQALQQQALLQRQLAAALAQIEQLQRPKDPPAFVKPNATKRPPQPRRKRDPKHNSARKLYPNPSSCQQHALTVCPDCGYHLHGNAIARRQVIELPPPAPVEVTEHQFIKRWCPHCVRWQVPKNSLVGVVLGQSRFGVRIVALIGYLRTMLRLPLRLIKQYLATMHSLSISVGQLNELVSKLHQQTTGDIEQLRNSARSSTIVHADETGWRQNGKNGYIWALSTPGAAGVGAIRYYEYDHSRGEGVVKRLLHGFKGVLISDFYAAYNSYTGKHQRCWAHLLRDLHELKKQHGKDEQVVEWAEAVSNLYKAGKELVGQGEKVSVATRQAAYRRLVGRVHELGLKYASVAEHKGHPCNALSKRLLRHESELFQYVLEEGVAADNNTAERSIRALVVMRKISGGSRSEAGTKARIGLFSLLETWRVRGLSPFDELLALIGPKTPLPQL